MACAHEPSGFDPETFVGWSCPFSLYGLEALDVACNIPRIDRARRHTRLDGSDDGVVFQIVGTDKYSVVFQIAGKSAIDHGDTLLNLEQGDLMLVDPARPIAVLREPGVARHVALHLPRQQLVAHLGYEPRCGLHRRGTAANRLLIQLITEALEEREPAPAVPENHMRLVIYDLLAAAFAPDEHRLISAYSDKLFSRICSLIRARFADPELTASVVAAEAGISVRYLQKLFSARGTTCSYFISSVRLDYASRILRRRALLGNDELLGQIAYACGFLDYAHFSRKFRQRFGHPPSGHPATIAR
nr:helix-turn-helix domain-containing protein [Bradyrhizobium sp. dw_78]